MSFKGRIFHVGAVRGMQQIYWTPGIQIDNAVLS